MSQSTPTPNAPPTYAEQQTAKSNAPNAPPTYAEEQPPKSNAANSSSWNDSGFAFAPNTNALDPVSMPSDKAEAARQKSAAVMAALKDGRTGDADALMGDQKETGTKGIVPLRWMKDKIKGGSKKKEDAVIH